MESLRLQLEAAEAQQAAAAQETASVEAEISALRSQLGRVQVRGAWRALWNGTNLLLLASQPWEGGHVRHGGHVAAAPSCQPT